MAEQRVQRRLAAILAADVVGYSRLMGEDESGTLAQLKTFRKEVFDPLTEEHNGRIVKLTGDGALVEFGSAVDAVEQAIAVQRTMARRNEGVPAEQKLELRIGVNLGDVIVDGDDIYGDGVNIAARLEANSEAGGISISNIVFEGIRNQVQAEFVDLGLQTFKNIRDPIRIYRVEFNKEMSVAPSVEPETDSIFQRPALAVLPFTNMSGDQEQEYFADGLTEDIISALSCSRLFPVIARNSTFTYKGMSVKVQQVAEELGARYVVEGSVRKAGNRVRVSVQLIDADSGHHLWADRFDRDLEDIFSVQDEITRKIAAVVEPELEQVEQVQATTKQPSNLSAWEFVHRGNALLNELTEEGNRQAREMYDRAIQFDSAYAPAHVGIAYSYYRDVFLGYAVDPLDALDKCVNAAQRAVALDRADYLAHLVLSLGYCQGKQFDLGLVEAEKSIHLNPVNAMCHLLMGGALNWSGKSADSIPYLEKAMELNPRDPRSFLFDMYMADAYLHNRELELAVERAKKSVAQRPDFLQSHLILVSGLGHLNRPVEAKTALDTCERIHDTGMNNWERWWYYRSSEDMQYIRDGLRKAGLPE